VKVTRVYTGDDGRSHFEECEIELSEQGLSGSMSQMWQAQGVIFRSVDGSYDLDFHNAPRRQLVVNLCGSVDIEIGDGTVRRMGPGSILLAEDTSGEGHKSTNVAAKV
jgi:hypothetical protein